ncbi:hypothetical protein SLEP1_g51456 [Rubroshorea leprosula]|uniref:Uncharacterized protein n=1 Tax=Rubroshorea leprosula TaxID=152421 RepID=A0AAV5M5F0_9ROSI|nr:hypothetical protein SLEP1_g51456 [Rubroshorea leprosula]
MTVEELSGSLEAYEEKLNRRKKELGEQVLQSNFLWVIKNKKEVQVKEDEVEVVDTVVVKDLEEEEEVPKTLIKAKMKILSSPL